MPVLLPQYFQTANIESHGDLVADPQHFGDFRIVAIVLLDYSVCQTVVAQNRRNGILLVELRMNLVEALSYIGPEAPSLDPVSPLWQGGSIQDKRCGEVNPESDIRCIKEQVICN